MKHVILLCLLVISRLSLLADDYKLLITEPLSLDDYKPHLVELNREDAIKTFDGKYVCARLMIKSSILDLKFESSYLIKQQQFQGEYTLYIAPGSKKIKVSSQQYNVTNQTITFRDYGILHLAEKTAYKMAIGQQQLIHVGNLTVTSTPSPALVYIDDSLAGNTTLQRDLEVGSHTIRVEKENYSTQSKQIMIKEDSTHTWHADLKLEKAPLIVQTDPQTYIYIDQKRVGRGYFKGNVTIGEHRIVVRYISKDGQTLLMDGDQNFDVSEIGDSVSFFVLGSVELDQSKFELDFENDAITATPIDKNNPTGTISLNRRVTHGFLGDYSVKFSRAKYWSRKKSVSVAADQNAVLKVPVLYRKRAYVFLQYQYTPKANIGAMIGICGKVGGYVSARYNIGSYGFKNVKPEENSFGLNCLAGDAGLMFRFCQEMYFYMGAGYGTFENSGLKIKRQNNIIKYQCANAEAGFIFNIHGKKGQGMTLTIGYNTFIDRDYFSEVPMYYNIVGGLGFEL